MTKAEFINQWLGKYHVTKNEHQVNFTEWAKNNGITIPHVDYGKMFDMAMINNKTLAQKGKWRSELSRYAEYDKLWQKYKKEGAKVEVQVLANKAQLALIHKRKVRLALRNNEKVSRETLKDYPDLIVGKNN